MSKKSKKEEHKVSMKRPSICALEDVNRNNEQFYNEVIKYLNLDKKDFLELSN